MKYEAHKISYYIYAGDINFCNIKTPPVCVCYDILADIFVK